NSGFRPDYFIIGEPTELKIVNSHKGCFLLDVIIEGKAAHASMTGWTDGATILHAGIPTLILGPGSAEQAHTADEFITIREVIDAVKIYLSLIFKICINKNC
ncbi:MAG: M20/M25/M40 family metallo-hydrolase, partial [Candidatus Humimicrobiaceae bacterium]